MRSPNQTAPKRRAGSLALAFALIFAITGPARSSDADMSANHQHHGADEHHHHDGGGHEDHSAHMAMLEKKDGYTVKTQQYKLSGLSLQRMDEQEVDLAKELATDKPVVLNFIFTTCTTICPVLSATFQQFQQKLGAEAGEIKMISISIDPEYDTPEKLREYAHKFDAGPQWQFYTGTLTQSVDVQRAFEAYRGGKMNHIPLTFIRTSADKPWTRLEGFTSATDLMDEYRRLQKS